MDLLFSEFIWDFLNTTKNLDHWHRNLQFIQETWINQALRGIFGYLIDQVFMQDHWDFSSYLKPLEILKRFFPERPYSDN